MKIKLSGHRGVMDNELVYNIRVNEFKLQSCNYIHISTWKCSEPTSLPYLPNPSTQAGYVTRSIFKRSLTGFSDFSFSLTSCLTKAEELSLSYYLPIAGGRITGFIPFPRDWTRVTVSISFDSIHYTTGTSTSLQFLYHGSSFIKMDLALNNPRWLICHWKREQTIKMESWTTLLQGRLSTFLFCFFFCFFHLFSSLILFCKSRLFHSRSLMSFLSYWLLFCHNLTTTKNKTKTKTKIKKVKIKREKLRTRIIFL